MKKICKIADCESNCYGGGYCKKHWLQVYRHGKILERTQYDPNEFILEGNICRIKLYDTRNNEKAEAIIDVEDHEKCKGMKWCLHNSGYAVCSKPQLFLHHYIIGRKTIVDHISRCKLDNRKSNLRVCSAAENHKNTKLSIKNTSGYRGVYWSKIRQKWIAEITINYKGINLGGFYTKAEAAKVRNEAALKYHKEFAILNTI